MRISFFTRKPRRRAILMVELIVVLAAMAVVSLLAGEMLIAPLKMIRESRERDTLIYRADSAIDALRHDAWAASAATQADVAPADAGIDFRLPAGDVRWRMNGATLTRTDAAGKREWLGLPPFHFTPAKGSVVLQVDAGPPGAARREHLSLETPLIAGGKL